MNPLVVLKHCEHVRPFETYLKRYYLKRYYLHKYNMDELKTCTQYNQSMSIIFFQRFKKLKKDGTIRYGTWCILCKADYNNAYMRR
jgi:hypothetical protein